MCLLPQWIPTGFYPPGGAERDFISCWMVEENPADASEVREEISHAQLPGLGPSLATRDTGWPTVLVLKGSVQGLSRI